MTEAPFGVSASPPRSVPELGQTVRWRGARWRVAGIGERGVIRLRGLDAAFRDVEVTPLIALEGHSFQSDELPLPKLEVEATDRGRWRALHRAHQITMAGGREQMVGLDWGAIAVEPYQLVPLMRVARTMRPRLLIADDAGLGKTAEAGIVLRWLAQRHQAARVLVLTRAAPEPQRWQTELWQKFGFRFKILRSGAEFNEWRRRAPTVNVFAQEPRLIVSMTLAARQALLDELRQCPDPFDAIIVDEAHHLAERGDRSKRLAVLGRELARNSRDGALLLLTATPHDGKTDSFVSLLRLLEPFVEVEPGQVPVDVASRLVVRRLKREVTLAGGRKFLTPDVRTYSTLRHATAAERDVEAPLDAYLAWLAEEEARYRSSGARQSASGCQFLTGLYRKRFGSSVAALRATLRRRLGEAPADEDSDLVAAYVATDASDPEDSELDPTAEQETPPPPLAVDEEPLARALLTAAERVPPGRDSKLEALARLVSETIPDEKVVVFTEYRDTLRAAARRLAADGVGFVTFHGATTDVGRVQAIEAFLGSAGARVFLATDAASEGINLQKAAHHLVHLDVPWNPNRYIQRTARIDRYGQGERPHVWAFVASDRRGGEGRPEARALEVVVEKFERIAEELGSVGFSLPGVSTSTLARILEEGAPDAAERVDALLDSEQARSVSAELSRLALVNERELSEAHNFVERLGTVDDFEQQVGDLLRTAFRAWDDGGSVEALADGLVRIRVPARMRAELGESVIERATFRRDRAIADDEMQRPQPEFLAPSHPLVEATLRLLREEATDPGFEHRFDVEAGDDEGLVLSFVARFIDGEGRTAEEAMLAVEVGLDGAVSVDPADDRERLGVERGADPRRPDRSRISRFSESFPELHALASAGAEQRAQALRTELVAAAAKLHADELAALGAWRHEEERRVELITIGRALQPSFEAGEAYRQRMDLLQREYERRQAAIRDRSAVRVASVELLGGRLIVSPAQ